MGCRLWAVGCGLWAVECNRLLFVLAYGLGAATVCRGTTCGAIGSLGQIKIRPKAFYGSAVKLHPPGYFISTASVRKHESLPAEPEPVTV